MSLHCTASYPSRPPFHDQRSSKDLADNLAAGDRDQLLAVVVPVDEAVLVDAQGVQDRRVQVVGVDRPLDGGIADRVGGTNDLATPDAAAGQPHRIARGGVV